MWPDDRRASQDREIPIPGGCCACHGKHYPTRCFRTVLTGVALVDGELP